MIGHSHVQFVSSVPSTMLSGACSSVVPHYLYRPRPEAKACLNCGKACPDKPKKTLLVRTTDALSEGLECVLMNRVCHVSCV
jgi:hypothetical protein